MQTLDNGIFLRKRSLPGFFAAYLFTLGVTGAYAEQTPEKVFDRFDARNFSNPTNIDNEWLPLKPGTHWVFDGTTIDGGEKVPHRIEFTVTKLTKEIAGVNTVVALVVDFAGDEMVEREIAFYAQDDDGNVWFFGEYPEEYKEGKLVEAPTWIAGIDDAKPGIKMQAKPQVDAPGYFQGWGPGVGWTDYAFVEKIGVRTCVPVNCYDDVIVIAESALDEKNAFQLKYYARGVGNVRVGWKGEDATQEQLELVRFAQLDPQALEDAGAKAIELEIRAYEISPDVYAHSKPLSGSTVMASPPVPTMQAKKQPSDPVRKISDEQAREIAKQRVPGEVMGIDIERKHGEMRLVVEVIADADGAEIDVIIDMETGEVLGIEN